MEEDDGSDMDLGVDEGSDMDVEEEEDTAGVVFDSSRADSFNMDFLNEEEEQFVAVMNTTSRLSSASRTHYRWSNQSPLARARARANGATSTGLPTAHPLLVRNPAPAETTTTTAAATHRPPRLLDSDSGAPFLQRLLNSGADAVLFGSARGRNSRLN